jgi:hypothetical protein
MALIDRTSLTSRIGGMVDSESHWASRELRRFLTSIIIVATMLGFMFLMVKCAL